MPDAQIDDLPATSPEGLHDQAVRRIKKRLT